MPDSCFLSSYAFPGIKHIGPRDHTGCAATTRAALLVALRAQALLSPLSLRYQHV